MTTYKGFKIKECRPPLGWLPKTCFAGTKSVLTLYAKTLHGLKCRITWQLKKHSSSTLDCGDCPYQNEKDPAQRPCKECLSD